MVNSHLVCDPTIRQPSFDLPRQQWYLLNRFRTEQGHCGACRRKCLLTDTDLCPCGETQTMSHIVESCPLTKLTGGLSRLHTADETWRCCFVADQLWFMTRIREEEEDCKTVIYLGMTVICVHVALPEGTSAKNAGLDNSGPDNNGQNHRGRKCKSWQWWTKYWKHSVANFNVYDCSLFTIIHQHTYALTESNKLIHMTP